MINSDNVETTNENKIYCTCGIAPSMYADTESSDFGYWYVCSRCNKRIEDGFHYYNHFEGEDHDDIDIEGYYDEENYPAGLGSRPSLKSL